MRKFLLSVLAMVCSGGFMPVLAAPLPDIDGFDSCVRDEAVEELSAATLSTFKVKAKFGQIMIVAPQVKEAEPVAKPVDTDRGFIAFRRNYGEMLFYNARPVDSERNVDSLGFFATPGEYEPITLDIYPLDTGNAAVSFSDLKGENGSIISAKNISVRWVKHMLKMDGMLKVCPEMLMESSTVPLKVGVTRRIWGTLKVPADAKAGKYAGTLTVKLSGKKESITNIAFEVMPFKLKENSNFTFAWYVSPKTLEEMKDYKEHGFNGLDQGTGPKFVSVNGSEVKLDWTEAENTFKLAKQAGLTGHHMALIIFLANDLINEGKLKEFSPEFNAAYKNMLTQMQKWYSAKGLTVNFWLVDEPREQALQTFHRNLENTIKYIKMANEIPGLRTLVDPTGDVDGPTNTDYSSLPDYLRVLCTHSDESCRKLIDKAKKNKIELILYNCDRLRISYGFNSWKQDAQERWEWAWWEWNESTSRGLSTITSNRSSTGTGAIYKDSKGGIISTPAAEIGREGVDDYRYIYTLEQAILAAEKSNPEGAKHAKDLLTGLKAKVPLYVSSIVRDNAEKFANDNAAAESKLDEWRRQIADEIVKLSK